MRKVLSDSCSLQTGYGTHGTRLYMLFGSITCSGSTSYNVWTYAPDQSPVLQRVPLPGTGIYSTANMQDEIYFGRTTSYGVGSGSLLLYSIPKQPRYGYFPYGLVRQVSNPYTEGVLAGLAPYRDGGYTWCVAERTAAGASTKVTTYVNDGNQTISSDEVTLTIPNNSRDIIQSYPIQYHEDLIVAFGEAHVGSFGDPKMRKFTLSTKTWSTIAMPATVTYWSPCHGLRAFYKDKVYFFGAGEVSTDPGQQGPLVLSWDGTTLAIAHNQIPVGPAVVTYSGSHTAACVHDGNLYYNVPNLTAGTTEKDNLGSFDGTTWTDNAGDLTGDLTVVSGGLSFLVSYRGALHMGNGNDVAWDNNGVYQNVYSSAATLMYSTLPDTNAMVL